MLRTHARLTRLALLAGSLLIFFYPNAAKACTSNADCDDGIACTDDICFGSIDRFCINIDNCEGTFCNPRSCCTNPSGCSGTPVGQCVTGPDPCPGQACDNTLGCVDCTSSSQCGDGNPCTTDTCNTSTGECVHTPLSEGTTCNDGNNCTENDVCVDDGGSSICQGTPKDCNADAPLCQVGNCQLSTGNCVFNPATDGTFCDDGDPCTDTRCQDGQCVEREPGCVDLEIRGPISGVIKKGEIRRLEVWARNNNCSGGGACGGAQPVAGNEIVITWDSDHLELVRPDPQIDCPDPGGADNNGNGIPDACDNPQDPCVSTDPCFNCGTATQYNWLGEGSAFPQDCTTSNLNAPCPGFPANDGDAFMVDFKQLQCDGEPAPPACVGSSGLLITRLRVKGKEVTAGIGPPAQIGIASCVGTKRSKVVSGVDGDEIRGLIFPPIELAVECQDDADCPGGSSCSEGACGALPSPQVSVAGPRYLKITPDPGDVPVALRVTGEDPSVACVSQFVQANGTLGSNPVYGLPSEWGTVMVRGTNLMWGKAFSVQADFDSSNPGVSLSDPVSATLWERADTDNNGFVSIGDIVRIIDAFRGIFTVPGSTCTADADCASIGPNFECNTVAGACVWVTVQNADLVGSGATPCRPDTFIAIGDVTAGIDAFRGLPDPCMVTCP